MQEIFLATKPKILIMPDIFLATKSPVLISILSMLSFKHIKNSAISQLLKHVLLVSLSDFTVLIDI